MDITILFKACVKTVRTTNKSLGLIVGRTNILKVTQKDTNLKTPKEIIKQISNLQKFFLENKLAYLNVVNYLSTNKTMTETDRLEIDSQAQHIINTCTTMILEYRREILKIKQTSQKQEHYTNIINTIDRYLKNVSKVYTEAKAIRVKKVIEMHKISKLETIKSNSHIINKKSINETPIKKDFNLPPIAPPADIDLSTEEMQMFESENGMLYNELNSLSDEVKQMESKVVHIAELQELFTEKVLEQEKDIDRIANIVAGTTDDMKDANEQIRQAIQRNAGLRVWVLFFLLVMSFSLLFLDWYND